MSEEPEEGRDDHEDHINHLHQIVTRRHLRQTTYENPVTDDTPMSMINPGGTDDEHLQKTKYNTIPTEHHEKP